MSCFDVLENLKKQAKGYWAERALAQCEYTLQVSAVSDGQFRAEAEAALAGLRAAFDRNGALTKADCRRTEEILAPAAERAKRFGMKFVGHAHIDMNWMWGYTETVAITLDTFRTMLQLMKEYPQYTFAQSQASTYRIVEEYAPEMLTEIRRRVREGRWEVTASTWVEADKNMSDTEAQVRQLQYTRAYLSKLLQIDGEKLNLDFEPDTFGHHENVPEILTRAGVSRYYHCRGLEKDVFIYRWQAPSGAEIMVNRENYWYNSAPDPFMAMNVPQFCTRYGIDFMLRVYGVGDHGGGPTRRDIERIMDMSKWPIFPSISFGTFGDYYDQLEKYRDNIPVMSGERNPIFTGCYTSQSRVKLFNKLGEAKLMDSEALNAMADSWVDSYRPRSLQSGWEKVMFSQFHDILPGSGVIETREYASGIFQQAMALSNTESVRAMRAVAEAIDTSTLPAETDDKTVSRSEGAGVGYGVAAYGLPQADRGRGSNRVAHFFNPSQKAYDGVALLTVWDMPTEPENILVLDAEGNEIPCQLVDKGDYWAHKRLDLALRIRVPALGYTTVSLTARERSRGAAYPFDWEGPEAPNRYVLENDRIRAVFSNDSFNLVELTDLASGKQLIDPTRLAGAFRFVTEDHNGMTAWRVGKYAKVESAQQNARIVRHRMDPNALRQFITFSSTFGKGSRMTVTVTLTQGSSALDYKAEVDWLEPGDRQFLPQLGFTTALNYACPSYLYTVPMGVLAREQVDQDLPALGLVCAPAAEGPSLYVQANGKYGFRCVDNSLSVSLLRSSVDPDPYPELCRHNISVRLGVTEQTDAPTLLALRHAYEHPVVFIHGGVHGGTLPMEGSLAAVEGASLCAVKPAEDGNGLILRVFDTAQKAEDLKIGLAFPVKEASLCDIHEKPMEGKVNVQGNIVTVPARSKGMTCLRIVK